MLCFLFSLFFFGHFCSLFCFVFVIVLHNNILMKVYQGSLQAGQLLPYSTKFSRVFSFANFDHSRKYLMKNFNTQHAVCACSKFAKVFCQKIFKNCYIRENLDLENFVLYSSLRMSCCIKYWSYYVFQQIWSHQLL